ncbi:MAG: LamG-like jellyroll fold domain-containing protein [Anaerolineae bacterium]
MDMTSGQQAGPNAGGFPVTVNFCGNTSLYIYENDNLADFSAANQQYIDARGVKPDSQSGVWVFDGTVRSDPESQSKIELDVTVGVKDHNLIGGALVNSNGVVQKTLAFPRPSGATTTGSLESRRPTVASDGDGFLVAYETNSVAADGTVGTRYLATRAFDNAGNTTGSNANAVVQVQQAFTDTDSLGSLRSGVAWVGDRYRVAMHDALSPNNISLSDFTRTGGNTGLRNQVVATDAAPITGTTSTQYRDPTPSLAYDPNSGRWLLGYLTNTGNIQSPYGQTNLYSSLGSLSPSATREVARPLSQVKVVYNPVTRGWMVGSFVDYSVIQNPSPAWDTSNLQIDVLKADDLTPLTVPATAMSFPKVQSQYYGYNANLASGALACPAPASVPAVELRFEEAPGATSFADSSGNNNNATCSGSGCPAAGVAGAVDNNGFAVGSPASDYAAAFDGSNDLLTVYTTLPNDFSIAVWVKADAGAANNAMLVDGGAEQANGFALRLSNGKPTFQIGTGATVTGATAIDDGQWHLVVLARQQASGAIALYLDGNTTPDASGTLSTTTLNAMTDLRVGGDRSNARFLRGALDNLLLYNVVLGADTVGAMYSNSLQSYCVALRAQFDTSSVLWTKLRLSQSDTRGGKLTAGSNLKLTVDADAPTSAVTSQANNQYVQGGPNASPRTLIIGGTASDATSGVNRVDVIVNGGSWQTAAGAATWTYPLQVTDGPYTIQTRATDNVGNVETPGPGITIIGDSTPPQVTLNTPAAPVQPARNGNGAWTVQMSGTVSDPASGTKPGSGVQSVGVRLQGTDNNALGAGWQTASVSGNTWTITYALLAGVQDATGPYSVSVRAADKVGNQTSDTAASGTLLVDSDGPEAAFNLADATRTTIKDTLTVTGVVTDTGGAGVQTLEIGFVPVEQAETQRQNSNPTWYPTTLTQPGAVNSGWSYGIPATLEGQYQIDLRGTDRLGNVRRNANAWRGIIDTQAPRVVMTATPTGASYVSRGANVTYYEVKFTCAAVDRYLDVSSFKCPGNALRPPTRSFENNPGLQALFPDWTALNGLANTYTLWVPTQTPAATASACDIYGHCTTVSTPGTTAIQVTGAAPLSLVEEKAGPASAPAAKADTGLAISSEVPVFTSEPTEALPSQGKSAAESVDAAAAEPATVETAQSDGQAAVKTSDAAVAGSAEVEAAAPSAAPAGPPTAVVVSPTDGSYVASTGAVNVSVAAQSSQPLKQIIVALDNTDVATVSFAQADNVTLTQQTVTVTVASEGQHTLTARATDWTGGTQTDLTPKTFILDKQPPTATIDTTTLGVDATYVPGSGILRFHGTANDTVGLAAVQVRVDSSAFTDANFGGGTWQIALPVTDPEGRTIPVTVRAIDFSGQSTTVNAVVSTNLSVSDAPDTQITGSPPNPSSVNTATFKFVGTPGGRSVGGFECKLDDDRFVRCVSPLTYGGLSKGAHTFSVRAVDSAGYVDLSPASFSWNVTAGQPDVNITACPSNPSQSRDATFTFSGDTTAKSFECSLDWAAFAPCASPQGYTRLVSGPHTFQVRARDASSNVGAPAKLTWTVVNVAPVAQNQNIAVIPNQPTALTLTATDSDPLTYQVVRTPAHGVLTGVAPNLTYVPDTRYGGSDSFTFKASDGESDSNVATVTIFVDNAPPVSGVGVTPGLPSGTNGWYPFTVHATVTATDGPPGTGVVETRCILDPASAPASFDAIQAGCAYSGAGADISAVGSHTLYVASRDQANNKEKPVATIIKVGYRPTFVSPNVAPPGVNNLVLPGSGTPSTPVKWGMANGSGAAVTSLSIVGARYTPMTCGAAVPDYSDTYPAAGGFVAGTNPKYDALQKLWVFNWKLPTTKGCYALYVKLSIGQTIPSLFRLN